MNRSFPARGARYSPSTAKAQARARPAGPAKPRIAAQTKAKAAATAERPAAAEPVEPVQKAAALLLWLLVVLPPLYVSPSARDPFRLPKLMLAEWLAIASLLPLAWALRGVEALRWRGWWRLPAVRAVLPLLAVAAAGLFTTAHPLHVREGLADLWIGGACLIGWSVGLRAAPLRRLLGGLLWPAAALAALGILQFHGLQPMTFAGLGAGSRQTITSLAGNPGDLAAFLVLPCLAAQWRLARAAPGIRGEDRRRSGRALDRRGWLVAALAVCVYAVVLTQTLAALSAALLGSLIFWGAVRRGRAGARRFAVTAAALALLAVGAVAAIPALRARAMEKAAAARRGDWNAVLTGRLDGWRAALWMLAEHPWAGVGHGAYRAEFVPAKLALLDRGVAFHSGQQQNFVNAHDEPLEVGADCGLPGLLALAWGVWVLAAAVPGRGGELALDQAARAARADRAFAVAGLAALGVLCLVDFPFRLALVAFPALLFLAWVLSPAAEEAAR